LQELLDKNQIKAINDEKGIPRENRVFGCFSCCGCFLNAKEPTQISGGGEVGRKPIK